MYISVCVSLGVGWGSKLKLDFVKKCQPTQTWTKKASGGLTDRLHLLILHQDLLPHPLYPIYGWTDYAF